MITAGRLTLFGTFGCRVGLLIYFGLYSIWLRSWLLFVFVLFDFGRDLYPLCIFFAFLPPGVTAGCFSCAPCQTVCCVAIGRCALFRGRSFSLGWGLAPTAISHYGSIFLVGGFLFDIGVRNPDRASPFP